MNRLTGLIGGNDLQAEGELTLAGPQPFSLAESVKELIKFANENDWDEKAIVSYVENQFLNNGLAGNLIDTLLGGFGTRAQLSTILVEELIASWNQSRDPEAVIESFVTFILNPPEVAEADPVSSDKVPGAASNLDSVTQGSNFGIESGAMDADTALGLDLNPPTLVGTNGDSANDRIYGTDADGNIVDLSDFTLTPGTVADAGSVLNLDGGSETMTDVGSNRQLASYTSAMQAVANAEGLTLEQRYDYMVDTTRFYLANWAKDHQMAIVDSRAHNQLYWLEESNLDPYLSRAVALLGRVGHNIYQVLPDIQSIFMDRNFREEAGKSLYQLISEPIATVSPTLDVLGELPLDQQIELGVEVALTGFVSGYSPRVGYKAPGATENVARELVDAVKASPIALTLRGGIRVTDDAVIVSRASRQVLSFGVPISASEVVRITRLSSARNAEIDLATFINPLNNQETARGDYRMSIDHILPVDQIVYQDGFSDLTIGQMTNLIQDKNGDLDNLMALPLSMNQSKGNRDALEWANSGLIGNKLDPDYVKWLDEKQEEVLIKVNALIQKYLNEN